MIICTIYQLPQNLFWNSIFIHTLVRRWIQCQAAAWHKHQTYPAEKDWNAACLLGSLYRVLRTLSVKPCLPVTSVAAAR